MHRPFCDEADMRIDAHALVDPQLWSRTRELRSRKMRQGEIAYDRFEIEEKAGAAAVKEESDERDSAER
jgi:hypothetical protein